MTFWTCLFKGTISSTVDFEPGGGIKEEAIYTKYLSSSSKRVVLCDVNFFKSDADELQISPKQTLCFSNEFVSSMVCSRLIYKKKENNSRVSKVRPSSFSSHFFLSDSLSAREKERREGLMRYKSQIFPLTYTSSAFVVFHQLNFFIKRFDPTKGAKKKSSRFKRQQSSLSLSLVGKHKSSNKSCSLFVSERIKSGKSCKVAHEVVQSSFFSF